MTKLRTQVRHQWAGLIALFLVLTSGSAYALGGSNTVFSDDIVDGQVKEADVGQGAVASPEIKNDSILPGDVAPDSLTSPRIADGSLTGTDVSNNSLKGADIDESTLTNIGGGGPAGGALSGTYPDPEIAADAVRAREIATDAVGSDELATIERPIEVTSIPPGEVGAVTVDCPAGTQLISGGAVFAFSSGDLSGSSPSGNGWRAAGQNNATIDQNLFVDALCLRPGT